MIDFCNVTKNYGKTTALKDLSVSLSEKGIYCLLGRNGAGKTTFMKLVSGKTNVSQGFVEVSGKKVSTLNMPENVRYIEAAKPQFNMRIEKLLKLASEIDENFDLNFARLMVKKFNLDEKKTYNGLSFGMKTMVTTIISLASNSDIILLDEPVLGFDAVMRQEFYELLRLSFENNPRLILVSTHLIDEIAGVADKIVIIDNGKLMISAEFNEIVEKAFKVSGLIADVEKFVSGLNVLSLETMGKFAVANVFDERPQSDGTVEISDLSLQELFVKMTGGIKNA